MATSILGKDTMISHRIEVVSPLRLFKGLVIKKTITIIIILVEFDICSLLALTGKLCTCFMVIASLYKFSLMIVIKKWG